jgi:tetratricopeptide (TPR) repeat protein
MEELLLKDARALVAVGDLDGVDEALAAVGDVPAAAPVRGLVAWYRGDVASARRYAEEAARHAPDSVEVSTLQALVAHADGQWERTMELKLAAVWNAPEMLDQVLDAYMCVTEFLLHAGDNSGRLITFARELYERASAAGARRAVAFGAIVLGEAHLLTGDPEVAAGLLRQAIETTRGVGCYGGESVGRMRLGEALAALGDHRGARAQLEEATELAHASSLSQHLLFLAHGALVRSSRDPHEALACVDRAEAILDPSPPCRFCPVEFFTAAAIACARAGEVERARGYVERAQAAVSGWSTAPRAASLAEARAEVLLAEGRIEDAEVAFLRAAERYAAIGHRLHEDRMRRAVAVPV